MTPRDLTLVAIDSANGHAAITRVHARELDSHLQDYYQKVPKQLPAVDGAIVNPKPCAACIWRMVGVWLIEVVHAVPCLRTRS
jgi:hypothetical protein